MNKIKSTKLTKVESFSNERYKKDLNLELAKGKFNTNTLEKFLEICVNVINQHATCKKKTSLIPIHE